MTLYIANKKWSGWWTTLEYGQSTSEKLTPKPREVLEPQLMLKLYGRNPLSKVPNFCEKWTCTTSSISLSPTRLGDLDMYNEGDSKSWKAGQVHWPTRPDLQRVGEKDMELIVKVKHLWTGVVNQTGLPSKGSPGTMLLQLSTDHHNWPLTGIRREKTSSDCTLTLS